MDYEAWIGREEERRERILGSVVQAMAATLDLERSPQAGEPLPPGWQWLFFNPVARRSALGIDGHPRRGGFLPPIELPRRMWAGSRIRYLADLPVEAQATRRSRILKIENKAGKTRLAVVRDGSTHHQLRWHALHLRGAGHRLPRGHAAGCGGGPAPQRHDGVPQWSRSVEPDTTLLFRYSALTFNGHRIHYDQAYARDEEGYPDLVVHGPLTATLLQQFALEHGAGRRARALRFSRRDPAVCRARLPTRRAASRRRHARAVGARTRWRVGDVGHGRVSLMRRKVVQQFIYR